MVRRRGPRLTLAEKTELWRRWRRGESLNNIGRALGRIAHVVRYEVARTGGPSGVVWRRPPRCVTRWPPSSRRSGRPSRSPAGSVRRILMIRRCTCRTKRST